MAVYRPSYKDPKTGNVKQSRVWWYHFTFAGRHIQESSKSTRKTIATGAEKLRRRALEMGFNNLEVSRQERIRPLGELAAEFLEDYRTLHPKSATFAAYCLAHLRRLDGGVMSIDVTDSTVKEYQLARLRESAAPKSVNEEVGFFLRLLGEQGDFIRAKMKRLKTLKVKVTSQVARAYAPDEKTALLEAARKLRSPSIYPALVLALNAGLRDAELRNLQWGRVDMESAVLTVGESKTDAGAGRTIPLNAAAICALRNHAEWYVKKFDRLRPEWYLFPFGGPQPTDPTKPMVSLKTAWSKVREITGVSGRWHDARHTFVTDLAESGEASDETIRDIAGHVSNQMLRHYSHIRMDAKRRAVSALPNFPPTRD